MVGSCAVPQDSSGTTCPIDSVQLRLIEFGKLDCCFQNHDGSPIIIINTCGKVAVKEWSNEGKTHRALCDVRTGRVHMYAHWEAGATPA